MDVETVIIGGGQAGLAMGHELARRGREFLILDANERVGESWRNRWDSLVLFTKGRFSGLPGMPFPGPPGTYPTKDETADYLADYAVHFDLPIRGGARVDRLRRSGSGYEVRVGAERLTAAAVVLATGAHQRPNVPALAAGLDPGVDQLHSAASRNPRGLPPGPALVVGAGNSGAEIALELARTGRKSILAGRDTGKLPTWLLNRVYWWLMTDVLTLDRRIGRRMLGKFRTGGSPLIRNTAATLHAAGIGRVTAVAGGMPVLEDGRRLEVATVVWATGFPPDYSLIDFAVPTRLGHPVHERGVVAGEPGLYLLGIPMLHALTSSFLGGVGRDAAFLAERITERRPAPTRTRPRLHRMPV